MISAATAAVGSFTAAIIVGSTVCMALTTAVATSLLMVVNYCKEVK